MTTNHILIAVLTIVLFARSVQGQKTDSMLLGTDHLAQLYKSDKPGTDVLLPERQHDIGAFTNLILPCQPDLIMVEVLPEKQALIDSLYTRYVSDKLKLDQLEDGRSEVYQQAFRLAKQLGYSTRRFLS